MRRLGLLLLGLIHCGGLCALSPDLKLEQLNYRFYRSSEGAPNNINALAQTSDGTLWIGGGAGLTRFDGVRFVTYPGPAEEPLHSTYISSLMATSDGGLWIGFRLGGVTLVKEGRLLRYGEKEGFPNGTVGQFAWGRDGSLWAAALGGLARFRDDRWQVIADEKELRGSPVGVVVDQAGTIWVATHDRVLARSSGDTHFREIERLEFELHSTGGVLAQAPDGRVWAAGANETLRVRQLSSPERDNTQRISRQVASPMLFDRHGNLWATDETGNELARVVARAVSSKAVADLAAGREKFSVQEGLNSPGVYALLEDREGNVWAGGSTGLVRLSHTNVIRSHTPMHGAMIADADNTLWVANTFPDYTLLQLRNGAEVSRRSIPWFTAASRDLRGTIWFGASTALARLENDQLVMESRPKELHGEVQALAHESGGALWLSVVRNGLFRLLDGQWTESGGFAALPRGPSIVATAAEDGAVWLGYPNDRVARVSGDEARVFGPADGLNVGNVTSIVERAKNLWIGGEIGLAYFDGARFVAIRNASAPAFQGISGMVFARNGDLWLNGLNGIARIDRDDVERILRGVSTEVDCEMFDYLAGLPGTAAQLRPQPTAVATADGRIWFLLTAGIVSIDPENLVRNTLPPPVTVWALVSGSHRYPRPAAVQLPVGTTSFQVEYSAGALTIPERTRFRYKLEGLDRDWQDAGSRREAVYTNLAPGQHTFRVTAANHDGVWNNTGASIDIVIPAAYHQTLWFYALCGIACLVVLALLYRLRVRQVAAQVRGRLEARLAERERIARDLHDTLLQGVQGLIWRFQAATDRIPPQEPARLLMEQSLNRADQLLGESRDRVKDLRPAARDVAQLAQALAAEGEQFSTLYPVKCRVSVHGTDCPLHPIVREEGFLIGREALANAFRHARARHIEIEVNYETMDFQLRIRDDGQGIEKGLLDEGGRGGHFGLVGMRERAKKLGGRIEVWSKPGIGTEVDLRIPAAVAYKVPRKASRFWSRLRSSGEAS